MEIKLEPGKYVAAVSGGVDSVALLDILRNSPDVELVVAHFDHGIRADSADDRKFVQTLAVGYGLPFEYGEGRLGPDTGEATARSARYGFLEKTMKNHRADAIITAHHEDDALETAVINLLRGTGRKGLSALSSSDQLKRPLLHVPKREIINYAKSRGLEWREDPTNREEVYLRNYVRQRILPKFDGKDRQSLLAYLRQSKSTNHQLDDLLDDELTKHLENDDLDRRWFNGLPHDVAREVMATWLRRRNLRGFDRKTLERLVVAAKTGRAGQRFDVMDGTVMIVGKEGLALRAIRV